MPESKGTILYVGGFELPDKNAAAHRVLQNAKIFKELGFNVVFSGVNKDITADRNNKEDIIGFKSFPISYPNSAEKWIKQMTDISHYENIAANYNDVKYIVCYNLHSLPLAKLLKFAKKKNIKIISDCTEWYENRFSVKPVKFIKFADTFLCMHYLQKKCDGMIAISSFLADYYKKFIKNIAVVPPLVDLKDQKYIFDCEKPKNTATTLVYSGSPNASKESLGEVVKCLNNITDLNFKLKIVGIDYEQFRSMYNVLPNREKIEFMGRVPHKIALQTVRESDYAVIIRPQTRVNNAGFPTKFAEAVSCGTAVIANDTSDLSNYLKDGKNGYLVSLETLQEDLQKILSSNKIPKTENDIFDYPKYKASFEELFKNL